MKFKFKIQQYQTDAVKAVINVFNGQPFMDSIAYLKELGENGNRQISAFFENGFLNINDSGFGNASICLSDFQLLENIRDLQLDNNIKQSSTLSKPLGNGCRCSLDIEMETGTGKTYCYIKTMFELNKVYGWSKFIIVVPSIAIREGVKKSFEVMEDHFFETYGKKARFFVYNSKNLNQIENFSASKDICVMIINNQAFASSLKEGANNETARIIYNKQDSFGSRRPIDVIAANRPIVILDEPQKLGGDATQTSLKRFNPLFSLNYSATHKDAHNLIYVLDALDAYNKKLVKKIEVKGFEVKNLKGTEGFVYLSGILIDPVKPPMARLVFEMRKADLSVTRISKTLSVNDNLYTLSQGKTDIPLEEYKNGYTITDIDPKENSITFLNGLVLKVNEVKNDISEKDLRRIQIRETIISHFEKEEKLFNLGIKCLSLFFIDEVAHYRKYDEDGNEVLGDFGVIFEEEYNSVLSDYLSNVETSYIKYLKSIDVKETHKGYFSIDKKGRAVNSTVNRKGECDDISAYDLILKNKERLLSFDEPTRFIFSHSALREGWDNPNVFQICTLKQSGSEINKRQEVGRGMRLCVNSVGDRIDSSFGATEVHNINVLTVIASDSYKDFVSGLQREIKETLYERPTKATREYFAGKIIRVGDESVEITKEQAAKIERYLIRNDYIDDDGNVTYTYREVAETGNFAELPQELIPFSSGIHKLIQAIFDERVLDDMVTSANKPKIIDNGLNERFNKKEFQELWKQINHKYAYSVDFNSEELIEKSVIALNEQLKVAKLVYTRTIGEQGENIFDFNMEKSKTVVLNNALVYSVFYDLIGDICKGTKLTRKTVTKILKSIRKEVFDLFKENPEEFIANAVLIINEQKAAMVVEKIKYNITDEEPYSSEIFITNKDLINIDKAYKAKNHITPYVIYDSDTEKNFAINLDGAEEVCVYAKLPKGFKIPTPMGNYSPDWAIAFYEGKVKYIYFVAETKGSMRKEDLKGIESKKIECAKRLFEILDDGKIRYDVINSYEHLLNIIK